VTFECIIFFFVSLKKSLKENFEQLKQKEELIINLRFSLKQYINDLDRANEILLQSENRIETLQSQLVFCESSHKSIGYQLEQEKRKNKVRFMIMIVLGVSFVNILCAFSIGIDKRSSNGVY